MDGLPVAGIKWRIGFVNKMTPPVRGCLRLALAALGLAASLLSTHPALGQNTQAVLTNAVQILSLRADGNFGQDVRLRGVVTAAQPGDEWGGRFFVQDETAGVFVENISTNRPAPGDLLEIEGVSHPGGYAPIISRPQWRKLGTAPLPSAKVVPIERVMAGMEDSQRIEISGIVRAFRPFDRVTVFEIVSGGYRLDVSVPSLDRVEPKSLVGAKVHARGTAATFYSGKLRHLITVAVHVPVPEDFVVEKVEPSDPFTQTVIPLNHLAQYRRDRDLGRRVHVKGVVTCQRRGEDLFLQDATGGMQIKSRQLEPVSPGDVVEAAGFPNFERFLPVLEDAVFRKTAEPPRTPVSQAVAIGELEGGFRHADMITLQGRVLDSSVARFGQLPGPTLNRTVLTIQSSNVTFTVEGPFAGADTVSKTIGIGSLVEVNGVCLMRIAEDGKAQSLRLLLPTARDIRIVQAPSWWTPRRLLYGLAAVLGVLLVAISWIAMIYRKNTSLKLLVREKEQAQVDLQNANDRLEERVRERSAQLQLQITARREAELQFKAVLNERTRLAQELHDTLEQTLTGIALQMDTAARCAAANPDRAQHHMQLARNLVAQSQAEVRCSVWDLRSRALDQNDLPDLLRRICRQLTEDTSIQVEVTTQGRIRPLPEVIEENLLRVAQEALTNILKHARATGATLALDYGPQNVVLAVTDNGVGFDMKLQAGPREGHFGLLGITERTKRLHGTVSINSTPGAGTTVRALIPLDPPPAAELANQREPSLS